MLSISFSCLFFFSPFFRLFPKQKFIFIILSSPLPSRARSLVYHVESAPFLHRPPIVQGNLTINLLRLRNFLCIGNILKRKCFGPAMASFSVLSVVREYKFYVVTLL